MQVKKKLEGDVLFLHFVGAIEETVNFETHIGTLPANLVVNCKDVTRINSAGVRAWISYFQQCHTKGTKFKFVECSPCVAEQLNIISNFLCGGSLESLYVPFFCQKCKKPFLKFFEMSDLRKRQFQLPNFDCQTCGQRLEFDGEPAEYFENIQKY